MNIVILNGSPRKSGNTSFILKTFADQIDVGKHSVEIINVTQKKVAGCLACNACIANGSCIIQDDGIEISEKVVKADMIVFASPIYWFGMTAQLKSAIDRLYGKYINEVAVSHKKVALFLVGGEEISHRQYEITKEQFKYIASLLPGELIYTQFISAHDENAVENQTETLEAIVDFAKSI